MSWLWWFSIRTLTKICGCWCVCALCKALILHHTGLTRVIGVSRSVIPTKPSSQKRNCFMPSMSLVTLMKTQKRQLDFWKEFGRGFLLYWHEWKRVWESHQHVLGVPFQNILKDYPLGIYHKSRTAWLERGSSKLPCSALFCCVYLMHPVCVLSATWGQGSLPEFVCCTSGSSLGCQSFALQFFLDVSVPGVFRSTDVCLPPGVSSTLLSWGELCGMRQTCSSHLHRYSLSVLLCRFSLEMMFG